jgi:hypothetical protein
MVHFYPAARPIAQFVPNTNDDALGWRRFSDGRSMKSRSYWRKVAVNCATGSRGMSRTAAVDDGEGKSIRTGCRDAGERSRLPSGYLAAGFDAERKAGGKR